MILFYKVSGQKYGCFSNFSKHGFTLKGKYWKTSEHYYQAMKFEGTEYEEMIRNASWSGEAANLGRNKNFLLRKDWELVKNEIMAEALYAKFTQNPEIMKILLSTGDEELIEDSPVDYYWGWGRDHSGKNMLGKLLMSLRTCLRKE